MTRADGSLSPRSVKKPKRSRASRQVDFAVAIALNAALLFVINAWPTWRALPFVTVDAVLPVSSVDWALIARIVIIAAIVGSVIGIIVQLVLVIRRLVGSIIPQPSTPPDEPN